MSDYRLSTLAWAAGLCIGGVLLLLFNFDILTRFEPGAQYLLSAILVAAAIIFFGAYASSRKNWWRLIPSWTLLALAAMVFSSTIKALDQSLIASLLFVGLSLAFFHIYLINRQEHWWAIIPGGFMGVLALVIALTAYIERTETLGAILFVGMGGAFFLLYALGGRKRQWWALIPGSVLLIFGIFVFLFNGLGAEGEGLSLRWWPILLILMGLGLGTYTARQPQKPKKLPIHSAPSRTRQSKKIAAQPTKKITTRDTASSPGFAPGSTIEILPDPDEKL